MSYWPVIFALAAQLGVKPGTYEKWQSRGGVPGRYHLAMLELAQKQRVQLPFEALRNPAGAADETAPSAA